MINDIEAGRIKVKVVWGMFSLLCLLFVGGQVHSDTSGKMAVVVDRQGPTPGGVQVSHDGAYWQELTLGDSLGEGDWVRTASAAAAQTTIAFDPQQLSTVTIQKDTTVRISQLREQAGDNPDYALSLTNGDVYSMLDGLQPGEVFQVQTPTAIITARGTTFIVSYSVAQGTSFEVYEGEVEAQPVNPVTAVVQGTRTRINEPEEADDDETRMMTRHRVDAGEVRGILLKEERGGGGPRGETGLAPNVKNRFRQWRNREIHPVQQEIKALKNVIKNAGPLASPSTVELYKQKKQWVRAALERLRELRNRNALDVELPVRPWLSNPR